MRNLNEMRERLTETVAESIKGDFITKINLSGKIESIKREISWELYEREISLELYEREQTGVK